MFVYLLFFFLSLSFQRSPHFKSRRKPYLEILWTKVGIYVSVSLSVTVYPTVVSTVSPSACVPWFPQSPSWWSSCQFSPPGQAVAPFTLSPTPREVCNMTSLSAASFSFSPFVSPLLSTKDCLPSHCLRLLFPQSSSFPPPPWHRAVCARRPLCIWLADSLFLSSQPLWAPVFASYCHTFCCSFSVECIILL